MLTLAQSIHVSLAYLSDGQKLGGNWRIELAIPCPGDGHAEEQHLKAELAKLKILLDHRALFTDLPEFSARPSTVENVALYLMGKINGEWTSLTIFENDGDFARVFSGRNEVERGRKIMNLILTVQGIPDERGLMTSREQLTQAVMRAYKAELWEEDLFIFLRTELSNLKSVRVDLGRGQYIVLGTED